MGNPSAISSGVLGPGTFPIVARKTYLSTLTLTGDGTNPATAIVYDNASAASGTILAIARCAAAGETIHNLYVNSVRADNGLTVLVTGVGAQALITYDAT